MNAMLRQFRRAPGRIIASVFALALAVGAIGVLAIPTISESSLHAAVDRDGLADIVAPTTPLGVDQIGALATLPNVAAAEGEVSLSATIDNGPDVRLIGLAADRDMDLVHLGAGREPAGPSEVVVSPGLGEIGESLRVDGRTYSVVGIGSTLWWSGEDVVIGDLAALRALAPDQGMNRLVITAVDDHADALDELVVAVRSTLAANGDTFTEFPISLPDGSTPIDADIRQVSMLIGMLGVVAGLVALILLASTTNTLITERTREVAVMRALGGRQRPLRRRLRRIAIAITGVALVIGLPLGIVISNVIARMVLEKFVGITPDVAVDWRVLVGSIAGMLLGARLVAARAARRVTGRPLAAALRDREGAPFGASAVHRLLARSTFGGLLGRIATRTSFRRPGRTLAVIAQISAAVGAAFLIPSLVTSVNEYNGKAYEVWQWESQTVARDPGLPFAADLETDDPTSETGIWVFAEVDGWETDVFGMRPDTTMIDPSLTVGRWIDAGRREAVVSAGFAERTGIEVGDALSVELASAPVEYVVTGFSNDFARSIYVDRSVLAADVGAPGKANVVWSDAPVPSMGLAVPVTTSTVTDIAETDAEGRAAIVVIFGAIGVIVAGVAALAVMSSMIVSLFERRHELAALQAMGARRRRVWGLLVREIVPLGALGIALGLVLGALGTRGIIGSFEASNAVDIGVVDAVTAIPLVVAGTFAALASVAAIVVRSAARRPIAVTLRGAA